MNCDRIATYKSSYNTFCGPYGIMQQRAEGPDYIFTKKI
jgi:hypothetical protein